MHISGRMKIYKTFLLLLPFIILFQTGLIAQNPQIDSFQMNNQFSFPENGITHLKLENQKQYDPLIGIYDIKPNGITSTQGRFFIRIQEPNMNKVIPMPGTEKFMLPHSPSLHPATAVPFHVLPKPLIPPIPKKD